MARRDRHLDIAIARCGIAGLAASLLAEPSGGWLPFGALGLAMPDFAPFS